MARPRLFTEPEFRLAYKESRSVAEVASRLNVSIITVYKRIKEYGLDSFRRNYALNPISKQIFESFRGRTTIDDLAIKYGLTGSSIRYHLKMGVAQHFSVKNSRLTHVTQLPEKIQYIKIVHELEDDPTLFDNVDELVFRTGYTRQTVAAYLQLVFEQNAQKNAELPELAARDHVRGRRASRT
jgi:hypothetical protein